jgi:uncharacterized membrane protein
MLILASSIALRWQYQFPFASGKLRIVLMSANLLILLVSEVTFEVKSLMNDGLEYFKSIYNQNDMLLFAMSIACLVQEIKLLHNPSNIAHEVSTDFDITELYHYGLPEQAMRISYSVLVISVHIKVMAVLQFYDSVAFLVEIMENVAGALTPVIVFFMYTIVIFCLAANALDLIFYKTDNANIEGDYEGMSIFGAAFLAFFRFSLGDFDLSTVKYMPAPQKYVMWPLWIGVIVLNLLVVVNMNVQVIEGVLKSVNSKRVEEAYQKKCGVLVELNRVFGSLAKQKECNVLITRLAA